MRKQKNKLRYEDPDAQRFSNLWFAQRLLPSKQKDAIVEAYVAYALALGRDIARQFANGNEKVSEKVGLRLNGQNQKPDMERFWRYVRKKFPKHYDSKDIYFLSNAGITAGWTMLFQFSLHANSTLVTRIMNLAAVYK